MKPSRRCALSLALLFAFAAPGSAKSPEDFVGQAPSRAQTAPQASGDKAAPADSSKRAADASKSAAPKTAAAKPAPAKAAAGAKPLLDTARIHGQYLEGDFDQATRTLEGALKGKKPISHADSVFAFKHLGVMYAASPSTRDKGRYYMLQLISIEPTARILDMYASDMIYLIFRNIQEEYENKHGKVAIAAPADSAAFAPAPAANPQADTVPAASAAPKASKRDKTLYWAGGGVAVAAGVAGLLFILLDDPQPKKRTIILKE